MAEGAAARALTPFVGREEELGLLARRWERARAGEGQLVLDCRRAGPRQIEADRGVPRAARGNAAHLGRMERLAAFAEHAAASNRRMGPAAIWCGCACRTTPRRPRRHVAADRPRPSRTCASARTARGHPAAARPRREFPAGRTAAKATGGDDRLGSGWGAVSAGCPGFRGPALGRPNVARPLARARRPRRASAAASVGYDPS